MNVFASGADVRFQYVNVNVVQVSYFTLVHSLFDKCWSCCLFNITNTCTEDINSSESNWYVVRIIFLTYALTESGNLVNNQ